MTTDPAVTAAAEAIHRARCCDIDHPGPHAFYLDHAEAAVAAARPIIEAAFIEKMRHAPHGWYPFGWHTNGGLEGIDLVFSDEVDDCGLPMYERLAARIARGQS